MKIKGLLFIFFVLVNLTINAQSWKYSRNEVQFGIGASNFLGDLGGANSIGTHGIRDIRFSMTRPTIMLGYKYMITPAFSLKGSIITSLLSGDDATTTEYARQNRNLSFRSGIVELGLTLELYPFTEKTSHSYKIRGVWGSKSITVSPYFVTGFGVTLFQPKANYNGDWVKLQPLGTEGQGLAGRPEKYHRYTLIFPIGGGFKYLIDRNWSIGFELSLRYTRTDYIDDVSTSYYIPSEIEAANGPIAAILADRVLDPAIGTTGVDQNPDGSNDYKQRGNPNYNDAYSFAIFSVHYRLRKGTKFIPKF
jgi:hypothetical protein